MISRITRNCLLISVNLCIIFIVIETGLRLCSSIHPIYDLEMHKYAIELKRSGSVPGLAHEHVPNSKAELMGVNFEINSMGFRDDQLKLAQGRTNYSILVLGCSNTVGWGVEHDQVFTSLVEKELNKGSVDTVYHVINAGVGNYNSYLESLQLDEKIDQVKPDMVVLHYYINDAEIVAEDKTSALVQYSYLFAMLQNRTRYNAFSDKFDDVGSYYSSLYRNDNPGWISAQNSILRMRETCKVRDVRFQVLIQPDLHDFDLNSKQFQCHQTISSFLHVNSISFLDLMPFYRSRLGESEREFWVSTEDAHPNVLGHQVIFEAAFPYLRRQISNND